MQHLIHAINSDAYVTDDNYANPCQEVIMTMMVVDVGQLRHTWVMAHHPKLTDTGANCCMMNNWKLLDNIQHLATPIQIGMAIDPKAESMACKDCRQFGDLTIICDDGTPFHTKCFDNPHASDTIMSLQAIVDSLSMFTSWMQRGHEGPSNGMLAWVRQAPKR
ncbi:hypothetical protein ACHAW6_015069 [Cyclotella cf. meneghiniana]